MAKIDKVKEFIGFLKAVFITLLAIMSSLIAYLYNKPLKNNYLVIFAIIIIAIINIMLLKKILKEINELEEL